MNHGDIGDSLYCLASACERDLPDVHYKRKLPKVGISYQDLPEEDAVRRPLYYECAVYSFPQSWPSTALGFGGIGGQAFTSAQTTVVISDDRNAAVYFGRRLAYVIEGTTQKFFADVHAHNMASVGRTKGYRNGDVT